MQSYEAYEEYFDLMKKLMPNHDWLVKIDKEDALTNFKKMYFTDYDEKKSLALSIAYSFVFAFYDTGNCGDVVAFEEYFLELTRAECDFYDIFFICHGLRFFRIHTNYLQIRDEESIPRHVSDIKTLFSFNDQNFVSFFYKNCLIK